ncbi:MAG TPA: alpha-glucuronidase family glycosyl hydrolase [Phnomibacter sp.]|nr:alpha-glucuronidase family glycosyl hydrolase [Phnomibacter sp.]
MKKFLLLFSVFFCMVAAAESGYDLWLRYPALGNSSVKSSYTKFTSISIDAAAATTTVLEREFLMALKGILSVKPSIYKGFNASAAVFVVPAAVAVQQKWMAASDTNSLGQEGFKMKSITFLGRQRLLITANTDAGLLYGSFQWLRMMASQQPITKLDTVCKPSLQWRMLNHWDNLTRTVERGYAGGSIWNWQTLPDYIDQRYIDYARANASIGINATVLTNVNANATTLTAPYLQKVKALADVFRPYHIKVFLTARFSAPIEIGHLKTADPYDPAVQQWWKDKAKEIYTLIPDFGGFLVKANSEGQPGPQNYGRNHADGANLLANAVKPYGGTIIWRAFVYSNESPDDRFKQPYAEFVPLDGKFTSNVLLQVKNGPIDFQPREPFHPLFGAMPKTPTMMEFQLTQEYLGFSTHLVYLAPMFKEVLNTDTYQPRQGSTVAKVIDGSTFGYSSTGMAGVSNIGSDLNWTGHPFAQANWYALGRLAWNPSLSAESIATEWIKQSFSNDAATVATISKIMLRSHEAVVNYMTPLGLHHIMGYGHHYGPAPWFKEASREDWNCTYFHKADSIGIGFNRTATGTNALVQYAPLVQANWNVLAITNKKWLTWFHHVPWQYKLGDGKTFWDELCLQYQWGVGEVRQMKQQWQTVAKQVDADRFRQVNMLLNIQEKEAIWWKDACLSYFQTFSKKPYPAGVEPPAQSLEYYQQLSFPYAPGNSH